jgi:hypothetical protein
MMLTWTERFVAKVVIAELNILDQIVNLQFSNNLLILVHSRWENLTQI